MATQRQRMKVSYTEDELATIKAMSKQYKLSVSELHRRLVLGHHLPDPNNFEKAACIQDLHRLNADQARLANLQLLLLNQLEDKFDVDLVDKVKDLVDEINATREVFRAAARQLHAEMHPRAK